MNSSAILILLCLLFVYTLFYTWINDFGMFLFIFLIILIAFYIKELMDEKINDVIYKFDSVKNEFTDKIKDFSIHLNMLTSAMKNQIQQIPQIQQISQIPQIQSHKQMQMQIPRY